MTKFLKQKNNKNRGFTLVETLVAISIFTMSVLSLMVVLSNGIANTTYAKKKITAEYLAQEGIEEIRNMRDTYMLYSGTAQDGWDAFKGPLNNNCASPNAPGGCYFNNADLVFNNFSMPMADVQLVPCKILSCPPLKYDDTNGKYEYDSGINSGFIRQITATQISIDEIKITSTIFWTQGSGKYNVSFSEDLFNWIE